MTDIGYSNQLEGQGWTCTHKQWPGTRQQKEGQRCTGDHFDHASRMAFG